MYNNYVNNYAFQYAIRAAKTFNFHFKKNIMFFIDQIGFFVDEIEDQSVTVFKK